MAPAFASLDHATTLAAPPYSFRVGILKVSHVLSSAAIHASLSLQAFYAFTSNDRNHDKRRGGVGPPPAQGSIQQQSGKQDCRKIGAEFGLFGIRMHR